MTELPEDKLLIYNRMGLIPGPHETRESFITRVDYSLNLKENLPEELKTQLEDKSSKDEQVANEILQQATGYLKNIYDCSPDWTPLFFSNYKLPFWQGGCAWIFQMTDNSPTSALIQLRKIFSRSPHYFKIYNRKELLAHELAHCGRMMFQEPKFEEVLAYRTANSAIRRWVGPLLQSSIESALFMLLLFVLIVFDVFLLALGRPDAYFVALWLKLIPVGLIMGALIRLWRRQRTLDSCIENLTGCLGDRAKAVAVAYRLSDDEIYLFARSSSEEIRDYAGRQAREELRWEVIFKAYFRQ